MAAGENNMTDHEAIELLIWNAIKNQLTNPHSLTEANVDPQIRALGNARLAHLLEVMGGKELITNVQPTLGTGGIGFAYQIPSDWVTSSNSREAVSARVDAIFAPTQVGRDSLSETEETISKLLVEVRQTEINLVYRDDLLASLNELSVCFTNECYIACLALSGKLLEICLKQVMLNKAIDFDDSWMIGRLLQELEHVQNRPYFDQSLPLMARIINKSRIPAVHAIENIPVPSREQAKMVISAVVDTMQRTLLI
jgi:hypothetical protein